MDNDLWLAAPCAAIKIWNDESGLRWQANPAALEWARSAALRDSDWRTIAEQLVQARAGQPAEPVQITGAAPLPPAEGDGPRTKAITNRRPDKFPPSPLGA